MFGAATTLIVAAKQQTNQDRLAVIAIPNLRKECMAGSGFVEFPEFVGLSAWLTCSGVRFRLFGPQNLIGLVSVRTEEEALTLLRAFSEEDNAGVFPDYDMREIRPGVSNGILTLETRTFRKFLPGGVKVTKLSLRQVRPGIGAAAEYEVFRLMLFEDEIYRVTEVVDSNGVYRLIDRKKVKANPSKLGILPMVLG